MDYAKTGQLIAQARKEKGMTQRELADQLHITDRAVSKWERGISFPDVSILESLSAALGVPMSQLITGAGEGVGTEETLQDGVAVFKREIKSKVRRTARLTVAIIIGVAILVATVCFLWKYVPAQRISFREIPLTMGEREIAGTNGVNAARFHIQLSPDVERCEILEETWTAEGLCSSEKLWDIPTTWDANMFDLHTDGWSRTRKMNFSIGFAVNSQERTYNWNYAGDGRKHSYDSTYLQDANMIWSLSYRNLSTVHLSKNSAVPLMVGYISDTIPGEFRLDNLQPGDTVSVIDGGTVKVLWLVIS